MTDASPSTDSGIGNPSLRRNIRARPFASYWLESAISLARDRLQFVPDNSPAREIQGLCCQESLEKPHIGVPDYSTLL